MEFRLCYITPPDLIKLLQVFIVFKIGIFCEELAALIPFKSQLSKEIHNDTGFRITMVSPDRQ